MLVAALWLAVAGGTGHCSKRRSYSASEQERRWKKGSHHNHICPFAFSAEEIALSRAWLSYTAAAVAHAPPRLPHGDEERSISNFTCLSSSDPSAVVVEYIEPLTGVARHPFADVGCKSHGVTLMDIFDTSHLVLANQCADAPRNAARVNARARGYERSYFFDLGTGGPPVAGRKTQPSSIPGFTTLYARQCIVFDRIFGWELQEQPPHHWWEDIPPALRGRVTFFNVGVAPEPWHTGGDDNSSAPEMPRPHRSNSSDGGSVSFIDVLRSTAHQDDLVVVKLDIDNSPIELSIVHEILENPSVTSLIDELFFEFHFAFDAHTTLYHFWGRICSGGSNPRLLGSPLRHAPRYNESLVCVRAACSWVDRSPEAHGRRGTEDHEQAARAWNSSALLGLSWV